MENNSKLRNKKLILAVSGGVDSMVLLDAINKVKIDFNLSLLVAHFEHGIRGEDSQEDAKFVQQKANELGIDFFLCQKNIPEIAEGDNIEKIAREQRYQFLYDLLKKQRADYILVAHHANDNAETILMNLIRGCGLAGLCGMKQEKDKILRPLLSVCKKDVLDYALENNITYKEDITNYDTKYTRNFVRQEIIPKMEELNPKLIEVFNQMSALLQQDDEYIFKNIDWEELVEEKAYGFDISYDAARLDSSIYNRVIYACLEKMLGRNIEKRMLDDVFGLFKLENGKSKHIKNQIWAYRTRVGVSIVRQQEKIMDTFKLNPLGVTDTPFGRFEISWVSAMENLDLNSAYFEGEGELNVRTRENGDKIIPFGQHSLKKVKDVMNDLHIPIFIRDGIPIVLFDEEILYIPGVKRGNVATIKSEKFKKITFISK